MTKLEELKAAYEAATKGEWDFVVADNAVVPFTSVVDSDGEMLLRHRYGVSGKAQRDMQFIALAHNLMPQLLEAVELIEDVATGNSEYDDLSERAAELLEKLK